ncbi:MAG: MBL fold metallo-hydrolase, partial [Actinomycetales bacterium]
MKVRLLGTGSADGWPNPFCTCHSCDSQRSQGRRRNSTAALVDEVILIDCGPTVASAAAQAGIDLRGVQHILITHAHPDHLAPALLLWRQWIPGLHPLHLWGPAQALALCQDWLAPKTPVRLHPVQPGDQIELEVFDPRELVPGSPTPGTGDAPARGPQPYRVSVHAAAHHHGNGDVLAQEAVLFGLHAPDATSLLYATDTGVLPPSVLAGLGGQTFDLALVDATFGPYLDHRTGHLDFQTL